MNASTAPSDVVAATLSLVARRLALSGIRSAKAGDTRLAKRFLDWSVLLQSKDENVSEAHTITTELNQPEHGKSSGSEELRRAVNALRAEPPRCDDATHHLATAQELGAPEAVVRELTALTRSAGAIADHEPLIRETRTPRYMAWAAGFAFASLFILAVLLIPRRPPPPGQPVAAELQLAATLPVNQDNAPLLAVVFGGSDTDLLRMTQDGLPAEWTEELHSLVQARVFRSARREYGKAMAMVSSSPAESVIVRLSTALPALKGSWLEDDANYQLALSSEAAGQDSMAAVFAARVLELSPQGDLANSRMRRLADTSRRQR